jgi:hypothetical protein
LRDIFSTLIHNPVMLVVKSRDLASAGDLSPIVLISASKLRMNGGDENMNSAVVTGQEGRDVMGAANLINDPRYPQRVRDAAVYIIRFPGTKGVTIAGAIHVSFDHFRKAIVPVLKAHGFRNYRNGNGYFPPIETIPEMTAPIATPNEAVRLVPIEFVDDGIRPNP